MIGPHVFGDGRLGMMVVNPANLGSRLDGFRRLGVTDIFLPRSATKAAADLVRSSLMFPQLWEAVDGRPATQYADDVMSDLLRLAVGAADLNIELFPDSLLDPYIRTVHARIRARMPSRRLRLNIAYRKGEFIPADLVRADPQLYACEQNYLGDMSPVPARLALDNLVGSGVPLAKAAICFGAGGPWPTPSSGRIATYPLTNPPSRGTIFQDDLAAEVGLL